MTSPTEGIESTFFGLRCQQAECTRQVSVYAESLDEVTLFDDSATATVDLRPLRDAGKPLCAREDCCDGYASATTRDPEMIAILRATASKAQFGRVALGSDGELTFYNLNGDTAEPFTEPS
jgi:hypothetical protein